jgi:hypothetical protein
VRIALAAFAALAAAAPLPAGDRPGAAQAFRDLQKAAAAGDAKVLEAALPDAEGEAAAGKGREAIAAWRKGLAEALAAAKDPVVREAGDDAVARWKDPAGGGDREIPLRWRDGRWTAAAAAPFAVSGAALDAARGRAPLAAALSARKENGPYGTSAYSFAHCTGKAADCRNRMDLWYCHNGDLHRTGDTVLARLKGKRLEDAAGIPVGVAWKETLAPAAGGVYAVRCRRRGERDFYVKLRVKAMTPDRLDLEWTLLASGPGAPGDLRAPKPPPADAAEAAYDGLCARNAVRSPPEPEPGKGSR